MRVLRYAVHYYQTSRVAGRGLLRTTLPGFHTVKYDCREAPEGLLNDCEVDLGL